MKSEAYPYLYCIQVGDYPLIIILCVDDLFLTGLENLIKECKRDIGTAFKMKDIVMMHYFLGLEVW